MSPRDAIVNGDGALTRTDDMNDLFRSVTQIALIQSKKYDVLDNGEASIVSCPRLRDAFVVICERRT
jgi:hypothetical protein